jgi:hypothetical protein
MSGAGGRFELDFVAHDKSPGSTLDRFAAFAHFRENNVDSLLVDGAQTGLAQLQCHPAIFALHPKTPFLQVGKKPALGLVVGVGDVITVLGFLPCHVAYASHDNAPNPAKPGL